MVDALQWNPDSKFREKNARKWVHFGRIWTFHSGKFTARREESESGVEKGGSRAPDLQILRSPPYYPYGIFQAAPALR